MQESANIESLDFELIVYRKGSLRAHVDLVRGYMTWHDSWQWCNNFTRTITDDQVTEIRDLVDNCIRQQALAAPSESAAGSADADPVSYQITLRSQDGSRQIRSGGEVPGCWMPLKTMIEKISRICFFI
ncbi:MAG: hypothetical protein GX112_03000 [Clostridiaceae bacterium]|nr:hypothetical protein [Clostridiaceae bacterium]